MGYKPAQELLDWLEQDPVDRYVYECMPGMWRKSNANRVRAEWVMSIMKHLVADDPSERSSPYHFGGGHD